MVLYRLSKTKYIKDLSGIGARDHGGRWNHKGIPVIYTAESVALANLEYIVNVPLSLIPDDISLAELTIPNTIKAKEINIRKLPKDWMKHPPPLELANIGSKWAHSGKSLLLKVPSAVTGHDFNYLINPGHPDMRKVKLKTRKYHLDDRIKTITS